MTMRRRNQTGRREKMASRREDPVAAAGDRDVASTVSELGDLSTGI